MEGLNQQLQQDMMQKKYELKLALQKKQQLMDMMEMLQQQQMRQKQSLNNVPEQPV